VNAVALTHTRRFCYLAALLAAVSVMLHAAPPNQNQQKENHSADARLQKAYRFQQEGWTYVHLEGSPSDIGFQHGYLLAPEIDDAF